MTAINSKQVLETLKKQFKHSKKIAESIYYYNMWEADFLYISNQDWINEVEIKVYRHDFVRDKDKESKYDKLLHGGSGLKKFYYACPTGMLKLDEIPSFAGLIYSDGIKATIVKRAPSLKNSWKYDDRLKQKIRLAEKTRYLRKFENRSL